MTERYRVAREIEAHAAAIAEAMAAWLAAGAQANGDVPLLPRDVGGSCSAVVKDLVDWLREDRREWYWPRANHPWWGFECARARYLACSAIQEYLRSTDAAEFGDLGRGPVVTDLMSRYFLHTWELRPALDPETPARCS